MKFFVNGLFAQIKLVHVVFNPKKVPADEHLYKSRNIIQTDGRGSELKISLIYLCNIVVFFVHQTTAFKKM